MKELFVVAHPDDAEVMLAYAIASSPEAHVVVATNGEGSAIDKIGGGFVRSGKRRQESVAGLSKLGVPEDRQYYLALPDGALADAIPEATERLSRLFEGKGVTRIVTLGQEGYDGHPDHIAAHKAASLFCTSLRQSGDEVALLALAADHSGKVRITGDLTQKTAAMGAHASQDVSDDITRWGNTDVYTPLIVDAETYHEF